MVFSASNHFVDAASPLVYRIYRGFHAADQRKDAGAGKAVRFDDGLGVSEKFFVLFDGHFVIRMILEGFPPFRPESTSDRTNRVLLLCRVARFFGFG